MNPKRKSAT